MSYLDNLESSLKNLEGNNERDPQLDRQRRMSDRAQALAVAPQAEKLKRSPFTSELLNHVTRIGYSMRVKVNMTWIGPNLRLDARERRLELQPTATGVIAVTSKEGQEIESAPIDLDGDPEALANRWLAP
jgi:hypothetical protein